MSSPLRRCTAPAQRRCSDLNADYNPIHEGPDSHRTNTTVGGDWDWKLNETWDFQVVGDLDHAVAGIQMDQGIVARGYRAPNLLELFSNDANTPAPGQGYVILGNQNLRPEHDLAWNLQLDFKPLTGLSGFLTLFRHDFDNLIYISTVCGFTTPCPPGGPHFIFQYQNAARALSQGVEVSVSSIFSEMPWWPLPKHTLRIDLSYGFLDSKCESGCPAGVNGQELPFRPANRFLPGATYEYLPLGTVLQLWASWEDRSQISLPNTATIPDYWVMNFKLSAQLNKLLSFIDQDSGGGPLLKYLTAFLEGQNVLDNQVVDVATFGPQGAVIGRLSFLAGVQFEL